MTSQQQIEPQGQSQKRIAHLFDLASQITTVQQDALEDQNLKLLLVHVDADYGLKSFLSLNDRGKPLSVLDKLKCLWMEKDENATSTDLAALHHAFGNAFRLLDHTVWGDKPFPEERFVRLLGIRAYWFDDTNCVWRDSEQLFDDYFRRNVNEAAAESRGALIAKHLRKMTRQTKALDDLAAHIAGTTEAATTPSPIIPMRSIRDDYRAFFQAWNPDNRSLAFLIRLDDLLGDHDWHTPVLRGGNDGERHQGLFRQTLDRVRLDAKRNNETQVIPVMLQEWWDRLDKEISALHQSQPRQLSALQVVERLDRFVFKTGKDPSGTLQVIWSKAYKSLEEALAGLLSLVDGSNYGAYFFRALLDESGWNAIYGHVVGEFEWAQDGTWLHGDPNFELEHIFPVAPPSTGLAELKRYGFLNLQEYQRFSGRLGNRILVWKPLNKAIGNNWPDIKAEAYANQRFAQTVVPPEHQRDSVINLGRTLQTIGDPRFYRLALEMRGIELALFALRRF